MNALTQRSKQQFKHLSICMSIAFASSFLIAPVHAAQSGEVISYDIQQENLTNALNKVAQQANVTLLLDAEKTNAYQSKELSGKYTADEAFAILLLNTPFQIQKTPAGYVLGNVSTNSVQTNSTTVTVLPNSQNINNNPIQSQNTQQLQQSQHQEEVIQLAPMIVYGEKDRDTQAKDAVYDQNISSVYSDKTTIERYKGANPADLFKGMLNVYSGDARNSGALDPNVRGIQGPGRIPLTIDGTEQAITVWRGYNGANNRNYIDPNLIGGIQVLKGPNLERNVNSGVGGAVVVSTLDVDDILKTGESFGGEFKIEGSNNAVKPRLPQLLTGQDYRNILHFTTGNLPPQTPYDDPTLRIDPKTSSSLNVFSGEDYAYRLAFGGKLDNIELLTAYAYRKKGNHFSGKNNTEFYSQDTSEYLHPSDGYAVSMANRWFPGYEVPNTSSEMESWLAKAKYQISDSQSLEFIFRDTTSKYGEIMPSRLEYAASGYMQWPLSETESQAYSLDYKINPEDNRWLDLNVNLWATNTQGDTYSRGGFPNAALSVNDPIIRNSAVANSDNKRYGITLSNKFSLLDNLSLLAGGSFQHEKLRSTDQYDEDWLFLAMPRQGDREEYEFNFNFDWQPLDFLTLTAGARYSSYWTFDKQLEKLQQQGLLLTAQHWDGMNVSYTTRKVTELSDSEWQAAVDNTIKSAERRWIRLGLTEEQKEFERQNIRNNTSKIEIKDTDYKDIWYHNGQGQYSHSNNICTNGSLDTINNLLNCNVGGFADSTLTNKDARVKKHNDHGWVPMLSATAQLNDDARVYLRYSEALRYPSMFESTLGFSSYINPYVSALKPEHAYNYELAYIHDFSRLLNVRYADIKLGYFHHLTKDVIERNTHLQFSNIEKQTIQGLELQGRYDNNQFFADLSVAYTLKNEVCDESSAALTDPNGGRVGRCIEGGFPGGYLSTQGIPKLSANLLLGTRLLDEKLELGGRITFHKKHEYRSFYDLYGTTNSTGFWNMPLQWDNVTLFDAYVNYKVTDDLTTELVGTNLSNIYYIDPISRSAIAAPGRTFKLAVTYKF